jgi:hypothetical protein
MCVCVAYILMLRFFSEHKDKTYTHTHTMYHLQLVLTNLRAMLSVQVRRKFEKEADCTDDEYKGAMYELFGKAIHQYRGLDYLNKIEQTDATFGEVLDLVKSWGYHDHEWDWESTNDQPQNEKPN